MRQFVRHPSDVPISLVHDSETQQQPLKNVSYGGICCISQQKLAIGDNVIIRIPFLNPVYESPGVVAWCAEHADGFDVGVEFLNATDSYKTRMVEQVCHIEHYRKKVLATEGRDLSAEAAAQEWIGKYAADFAQWVE